MKHTFGILALVALVLTSLSAYAQEMNSLMFRAGVKSPELKNDSVTFRFVAPKARKVGVSASWLGYDASKLAMTQGQDGIWSVTIPQPAPELYTYTITFDGSSILTPSTWKV